jgi:uncharacterized protein (TIGR03437 family)
LFVVDGIQGAVLIAATGELAATTGRIAGRPCRPANRGEWVSIFCTGLGPVNNQPASGASASGNPLSVTLLTPTVTIGRASAVVNFSGLAPGYVGLYQINAQVPLDSTAGRSVPVEVRIGSFTSNTAYIAVQ